jgi:hypothetical protein
MPSNDLIVILLVCSIISVICSISALVLGAYAALCVKAQELSTHQMEYIPLDPNWASSDKDIEQYNEEISKEDGALDDDDLDPHQADLKNLI